MALIPDGGRHRNQFVLGPAFADGEDWKRLELPGSLKLTAHPLLPVHRAEGDGITLTLIGFVLDWARPEISNQDILERLLPESSTFDACWRATAELCGRWVVIYQRDGETRLFHDASGLRQVCFATGDHTWCASQPGLLAGILGLEADRESVDFIDWHETQTAEYWWPGDRLAFRGARALLPNHALNMATGEVTRYWPGESSAAITGDAAQGRITERLTGIMRGATSRYEVALGLSAGWDSRVLLAASRDVIDRIEIFNGRGADMPDDHRDIVIPRRLMKRLGRSLVALTEPPAADEAFSEYFMAHCWRPHPRFRTGMQSDFSFAGGRKVAAIGNVAEIGKLPFRAKVKGDTAIDASFLASLYWDGHPYAEHALKGWLDSLGPSPPYHVLDLFYWEQRLGRWLSANCLEFDVAWRDFLAPFNIRGLMVDLLACDDSLLAPPRHELFRRIIHAQWPELLAEPVNPARQEPLKLRLRRTVRRLIKGSPGAN